MSAALMGRATWHQGITLPEKMVLVAIADVSDDTGLAYMLIETLMMKTSASRRGVQTALAGLIDKNILLRKERRHRSSIFKIVVESLPIGRPPVSEKEMNDDHFWENIEGAGDAPSNKRQGAGYARQGARAAPQGAGDAHILPVETPVLTPEEPPLPSGELPLGDLSQRSKALAEVRPNLLAYVEEKWSSLCDDFPRTHRVIAWNDSRKKAIARRAQEIVLATGGQIDAWQVWDMIFAAIRASRFLRGELEPTRQYATPFSLEIDYILRPKEFARTLERAETNDHDTAASSDPRTGREFGPAEQAARAAVARLNAARKSG